MNLADRIYKNFIYNDRYLLILEGIKNTLTIVILTCILGGLIGIIICSIRMSKNKVIAFLGKIYIFFFRGTPMLLLLIFSYFVVFANSGLSSITIAIIAFSIYHSTFAAEIFRSAIISIRDEQLEASVALGYTKKQAFFHILLPQVVRIIFPVYRGEIIRQTSITSVVGYIGVQDLTRATDIIRSQTFDALFPLACAGIIYFVIIGVLIFLLNIAEKLINPRKA